MTENKQPDAGKIQPPGGEVWYADLTSFRGVSLGAIHWYLRVTRGHGRRLRVERVLTATEAEAETASDDRFRWKEGQWKEGWTSVETAEAAAVAVFRYLAANPDRDVLLLGSLYSVPDKVLAAPPDVAAEIAAVDRDDYRGMDRLLASHRLTVRPGPGRYGPDEPPEDPDLPEEIAVGPDGVEIEERDLYGDVTTLVAPDRGALNLGIARDDPPNKTNNFEAFEAEWQASTTGRTGMSAQRYTDPLASERMEAGGCPECGAPVDAHNGGGGPRCTLTDNGVAARLDQYRQDRAG